MRILIVCILVLIKFAPFAAANEYGFTIDHNRKSVSVPIKVKNNVPIVSLYINDTGPLTFILDTGVKTSILTNSQAVHLLGLNIKNQAIISGLGGKGTIEAHLATGVEIRLKGITGHGMNLLIIPENSLSLSQLFGFHIHGILGYDFFKSFPVQINYAKRSMKVYRDSHYRIRRWHQVVPLQVIDGKPYMEVNIVGMNGDSLLTNLLLDLGASNSIYLNMKYLSFSDRTITGHLGSGLGGCLMGEVGRLKSVKISSLYSLRDPIVYYPDTQFKDPQGQPIKWDGLIGGEILRRFILTFDYSSKLLVLRKSPHFGETYKNNLSGLEVEAHGNNLRRLVVSYVRPGSAASDAGVKPGDIIMKLNAISYHYLEIDQVLEILSGKAGEPIFLKVLRNNKAYQTKFKLRKDI